MGILSIISALLPFLLSELAQFKVISPALANLIAGIEAAAQPLLGDAVTVTPPTATAILASISAAVKVLQQQTTLSPGALAIVQAIDLAIVAGLGASQVTAVVPGNLTPETPIAT